MTTEGPTEIRRNIPEEQLTQALANAQSLKDMIEVFDSMGEEPVIIGGKEINPVDLKSRVIVAFHNRTAIKYVTRSFEVRSTLIRVVKAYNEAENE